MRELTPELYTELNKTIDRLRKEKKDLAFENIDLKQRRKRTKISY